MGYCRNQLYVGVDLGKVDVFLRMRQQESLPFVVYSALTPGEKRKSLSGDARNIYSLAKKLSSFFYSTRHIELFARVKRQKEVTSDE